MGTVAHHRAKALYFLHRARAPCTANAARAPATPANPRTPPRQCPRSCWKPPPPCAAGCPPSSTPSPRCSTAARAWYARSTPVLAPPRSGR